MFKVGDKVKCIGMGESYNYRLLIGQTYIVKKLEGMEWLQVEDDPNGYGPYEMKYFELAEAFSTENSVESCLVDMVKSLPKRKKNV